MSRPTSQVESLRADQSLASIHRSLDYYYGNPAHEAALDSLYAQFVNSGDLVFDVGAHVGDRVGSFRRLGARVVAVEPQADCVRALNTIYSRDEKVIVVDAVCGESEGQTKFYINSRNPTVSTASTEFIQAAGGASGWEREVWDATIQVPCVSLDHLIDKYGEPTFIKIDVEGFEKSVLAGLSKAVSAVSFEFTIIERAVALECIDRAVTLGFTRFNFSLGDSMQMSLGQWCSAQNITSEIEALPHSANAGDVYCAS